MQRQVVFGTGPLGVAVMRELLARGNDLVRMVNRSGKRGDIPRQVEVVACDAYDKNAVQATTQGAEVVYQCAQPAYTEWPEKFPPLQTAILEGTAASGAKLIVGDNLYMYGPTGGQPLREDLPYRATGKKGVTRARMAEQLLEAHKAGKVRVAIARGSDFYGEGVRNSLLGDIVFGNLLRGKAAQVMGNIDLPHTVTCIDDFGKALVMLGERDEALGQIWHVPNAEPQLTLRAAIERIAAIAGVPARISLMPRAMFEIISLFHPMLREFRELRHQVNEPYVVDHAKFVAAFGDLSTPFDEGVRRTVDWYRGQLSGGPTRGVDG
jgi:nucleoside-diphosphate-sugar epimerase